MRTDSLSEESISISKYNQVEEYKSVTVKKTKLYASVIIINIGLVGGVLFYVLASMWSVAIVISPILILLGIILGIDYLFERREKQKLKTPKILERNHKKYD